MQFVKDQFSETYEIKKSKFIAYFFPYNNFNNIMEQLKKEHPKARHHVYAYRYLNEFDQVAENCSDDGEPKGTSGKPSLAVLSGQNIINSAVIIVRYFGGIKLGTGGLVKAYSDAVNLVLSKSELYPYIKLKRKYLVLDYHNLSKVEYQIEHLDISIVTKEFLSDVKLILEASNEEFNKLQKLIPRELNLLDAN